MRKSEQLDLSIPYDWSNSNISDDVLIEKALERHYFQDVAKLCVHFGLERVNRVFMDRIASRSDNALTVAILTRMLRNIKRGIGETHA